MKILGIDPGLTRCGVGVISADSSRRISLVQVDTFRSDKDAPVERRIGQLGSALDRLISEQEPDLIAIERVFAQSNVSTVMGVAQITGVILYLASRAGIPVRFYTPSEVKAAVTGSGRAAKAQIGSAVTKLLNLDEIPKPADSADALAVAIAGAWKQSSVVTGSLTPAQETWLAAQRASKRRK